MEKLSVVESQMIGDAFKEFGPLVAQVANKYSGRGSRADFGDLESYLNEKFMEAVLRYDETKGITMGAYLNSRLSQHALNYLNSSYAGYANVRTPFSAFEVEGESDDTVSPYVIADDYDLQNDIIKQQEIKRTISALFSNATDLQRKIMEAYLTCDTKPSFAQIGRVVGVHHEIVRREMMKLRKITNFDASLLS